ncbi:MAG: CoA transferase [Acidimicrobiales bacterium]|nr:CoA transferase [Acidimicrobiales bacterium]
MRVSLLTNHMVGYQNLDEKETTMRSLDFSNLSPNPLVSIRGTNASVFYAQHWLQLIGIETSDSDECLVNIEAGDPSSDPSLRPPEGGLSQITLWDFQVGQNGNGLHAAAASGVSWVLGHTDGPPLALPLDIPEKWCGLIGANWALASLLGTELGNATTGRRVDIASADILRSFADQNAGNHAEVEHGWRRNGSIAVEHGGIYPQGYFPCMDGNVGIVGRSRKDWEAIREVIGRPPWADDPRFNDPFELAANSEEVDLLLTEALAQFNRDDLLGKSIHYGATLAPVYTADELRERGITRPGTFNDNQVANLPFNIISRENPTETGNESLVEISH